MLRFYTFSLSLLFSLTLFAQDPQRPKRCSTLEVEAEMRAQTPSIESRAEFEQWLQRQMQIPSSKRAELVTIPVVVHVIHDGESVGDRTNISQAQVQSQIDVLNEDFRKTFGTPGYNEDPVGADIEIEFCLAVVDPNGDPMPEHGVHRVDRNQMGWIAPPFSSGYINQTIKPATSWDPNQYMNIWTVELPGVEIGFAQWPNSSGLSGVPSGVCCANTDGVVVTPKHFGREGFVEPPYDQGRTTTHEVGHFFGLIHTWGDGGCGADDFCADTPESDQENYGCPTGSESCGSPDMYQNYMYYTDDACMNIFTACQKTRMRTVLENSPRRLSLINSDVCIPRQAPSADVKVDRSRVCEGTEINFLGDPAATAWSWSFPGGVPDQSTEQNPSVLYTEVGSYDVTQEATNDFGSTTQLYDDLIVITDTGQVEFLFEDFEQGLDGWSIDNPDGQTTWSLRQVNGPDGPTSAMWINLFDYGTTGQKDGLISPALDLSDAFQLQLSLSYAYQPFSNGDRDSLVILASLDDGATWPIRLFSIAESGCGNFRTVAENAAEGFLPSGPSDWCGQGNGANCLRVDLRRLDNESNVRLRFETVNDFGNNLFINEISILGRCQPGENTFPLPQVNQNLLLYPNPNPGQFYVYLSQQSVVPCDEVAENAVIEIFDLMGRKIHEQALNYVSDVNVVESVDIRGVRAGIYLVRVRSNDVAILEQKVLIRK
ncbi:MAG: M43 family zinc metalloprotease [Bacteroidota bacterium]